MLSTVCCLLAAVGYVGVATVPSVAPGTSAVCRVPAILASTSGDFEPKDKLDVAAPPRALPKPSSGPPSDPLGLWKAPKKSTGPHGPNLFELNRGRAIDALRRDYPELLTRKPDLSIFSDSIELHDPSGKRLSGIKQYERMFDALRFLRRTTMQDAQLTYRLVLTDQKIRVRWTAQLWMRDPVTGLTKMGNGEPALVHLDGVSRYDLDGDGMIYAHRLETIVMRGQEKGAQPVQLALAWPSGFAAPELTPGGAFFRALDAATPAGLATLFQEGAGSDTPSGDRPKRGSTRGGRPQMSAAETGAAETPMERAARERAEDDEKAQMIKQAKEARAAELARDNKPRGLFGQSMPQPCETSYDCDAPEVCCDLLFTSVCCSGGLMIPTTDRQQGAMQRQAIPIPVEADDDGPAGRGPPAGVPPQYPGGRPL